MNKGPHEEFFREIHAGFEIPLCSLDCGLKCGPHNDYGVPVCCDIGLVIPAAYETEWVYLQKNTDLWTPWSSSDLYDHELDEEVQDGQVLLQCKGYQKCQRPYRTLTCRAFPFYPYLTSSDEFLGLGYYVDFRDQCWIMSNLSVVTAEYKTAFRETFEKIFDHHPQSRDNYLEYSNYVRQQAEDLGEKIVVMDFQESVYLIDPATERIRPTAYSDLEAFGPYQVTRELRFPDETHPEKDNKRK